MKKQKTAAWREHMTPAEAKELDKAERARTSAADRYRAVFTRLKNRCIQRARRKADLGKEGE